MPHYHHDLNGPVGRAPPMARPGVRQKAQEEALVAPLLTPRFPLRVNDQEGRLRQLSGPMHVALDLEFLDDNDEDEYQCVDADERRVRLIVWNLELLVCQVVPVDFSARQLTVVRQALPLGGQRWVEGYQGRALRAFVDVTDAPAVEPRPWDELEPADPPAGLSELTGSSHIAHFHDRWMALRLDGRYP